MSSDDCAAANPLQPVSTSDVLRRRELLETSVGRTIFFTMTTTSWAEVFNAETRSRNAVEQIKSSSNDEAEIRHTDWNILPSMLFSIKYYQSPACASSGRKV